VSKEFKNVVYVFGNHEHYHGDFVTSTEIIRTAFGHLSNVHILDIDSVDIDGVLFVGGTLWTNFKNRDPVVMWDAQAMMNDYRTVRNGPPGVYGSAPKFLPEDAVLYHEEMLKTIDAACKDETRPIVVVGHHAPSFQSISGRYGGDKLNGAYASDLVEFVEQHPQIKLWTHGHIHNNSDYMIGSTRVLCNPRGYHGYEENYDYNPGLVFEL
jgi:Icc-related predicted phosphoesterase